MKLYIIHNKCQRFCDRNLMGLTDVIDCRGTGRDTRATFGV